MTQHVTLSSRKNDAWALIDPKATIWTHFHRVRYPLWNLCQPKTMCQIEFA